MSSSQRRSLVAHSDGVAIELSDVDRVSFVASGDPNESRLLRSSPAQDRATIVNDPIIFLPEEEEDDEDDPE